MINGLLWVGLILTTFSLILLSYRLFGLYGLYGFSAFALIVANIQVLKAVEIFGVAASIGSVVFSATFLITDIIGELYGKDKARTAVYIGFFSTITFLVFTQISLAFIPSANDWANPHLSAIFSLLPRVTLASLGAYFFSNMHDVWAYSFWRKKFPGKKQIWIRNNASTIISQLLDSIVFASIAFIGLFPIEIFFQLAFSTYLFKVVVAAADTPFVYAARWLQEKGKVGALLAEEDRERDLNEVVSLEVE